MNDSVGRVVRALTDGPVYCEDCRYMYFNDYDRDAYCQKDRVISSGNFVRRVKIERPHERCSTKNGDGKCRDFAPRLMVRLKGIFKP